MPLPDFGASCNALRKPIPTAMASEAASNGKRRGRPPVFSDRALQQAAGFSYARRVGTRRGAQDLVYRMFAVAAIELYCEAHPEQAVTLDWLLKPTLRHALLSELGRVAQPRSDEAGVLHWNDRDVDRLIGVALEIARRKPSAKAGSAMIRDLRRRHRGQAGSESSRELGVP
jgi:hypothetical protein